ncbi:MAG: hypothetical protein KDD70_18840, partial [Bdellovibrionales bacterium]|nr:hypothetical protein [Bdellovibrionales bacterium]
MTHFLIFLLAIFASNLFTDHLSDMKLHGAQKFRYFRGRVSQACPIIILALASILPVTSFAQSAPQVIVAEVRMADWFDSIEALGTLRANETVVLTASVT